MIKIARRILAAGLWAFWTLQISGTPSMAEVTEWQDLGGGRVRLVSIFDPVSDKIEGIVEVELMPGWVTYWRNPGESGIPPIFDFSGSSGIAVNPPEFPVPSAKETSGIISIVYKDHVAFPFAASPLISPLSGKLQLELSLGVCEEICIPAIASLSQNLSMLNQSDPISNGLIEMAKRKIPVADVEKANWPQILSAERESNIAVLIRTQIPESASKPELFAEGKDTWFFYPAKLLRRDGQMADFELDLKDLPKDADLSEVPLRLTLSADGIGSERTIIVDKTE
jgi:DsbC/DsbD-like thiol-disulfide interchange protein